MATVLILLRGWNLWLIPVASVSRRQSTTRSVDKVHHGFDNLGEQNLKNLREPVRVYRVRSTGEADAVPSILPLTNKPSVSVLFLRRPHDICTLVRTRPRGPR